MYFSLILSALAGSSVAHGAYSNFRTFSSLVRRDNHKNTIKSQQGRVQWNLECIEEKETCTKVAEALSLMGQFMENAILLEPIVINLKFVKECDSFFGKCERIGKCQPSHLIRVNEENLTLLYPQALYKQTDHNEVHYLKPHDMEIEIDAYYDYYFPSDYPSTQGVCEMDFLTILTHEVLHGLGFYSSLHALTRDIYAPILELNQNHSKQKESLAYLLFTKFDKYIESDLRSVKYYIKKLEDLGPVYIKPNQDYKTALMRHPHITLLKELVESSSYYFNSTNGERLYLDEGTLFSTKSFSHANANKYKHTKDETMAPKSGSGVGIHDIFNRDKKWETSPFGPRTLNLLHTLGYKINPNPKYENSMEYHYAKFFTLPRDKTDSFFFRCLSPVYLCRKTMLQ